MFLIVKLCFLKIVACNINIIVLRQAQRTGANISECRAVFTPVLYGDRIGIHLIKFERIRKIFDFEKFAMLF